MTTAEHPSTFFSVASRYRLPTYLLIYIPNLSRIQSLEGHQRLIEIGVFEVVGYARIHHALRHLRSIKPHGALHVLLVLNIVLLLLLNVVVLS